MIVKSLRLACAAALLVSCALLAGRCHSRTRLVAELGSCALDRDRPDVCEAEVVSRQADRRRLRHLAASVIPLTRQQP
jgi:hypothetical protein